jgi:hypothetical protein
MFDKKGLAMKTIISIALITFAFFIILGLWKTAAGKTEGAAAEELCHTTNALRVGTSVSVFSNKGELRAFPRGCKVQDIGKIPDKEHLKEERDPEIAAMNHVSDLARKCWWMWLEGEAFGKNVLDPDVFSKKKCFLCYTFELEKNIEFAPSTFRQHIRNDFYQVRDTSDQCSSKGGICKENCALTSANAIGNKFKIKTETSSCTQSRPGTECCLVSDRYTCENRGGNCGFTNEFSQPYNGWTCPSGKTCYVKENNYFSTAQYIESFNGRGAYHVNIFDRFKHGEQYAVVFVENVKSYLRQALDENVDSIFITEVSKLKNEAACAIEGGVTD